MPIKCTFRDVARLRETPENPGPLSKLADANCPSVVDKFRVVRFIKAMGQEIQEYEAVLIALGKKFGTPIDVEGSANVSYRVLPENMTAFNDEVARLNSEPRDILAANPLPPSVCDILTPRDLLLLGSLVVEPEDPSTTTPASK